LALLPLPAHHWGAQAARESLIAVQRYQPEGNHWPALALERQRVETLYLDSVARQPQGLLGDQDLARLRRLLQAGGNVDCVAGCKSLFGAGHDFAGGDTDSSLDAEFGEGRTHLGRRSYSAKRVVLVHHRHAEDRHHGVADELLYRPAVALDDRLHALEVAGQQRSERLGIEFLT